MRALILLMAVTLTTTASAAAPAYELVWPVGNALFRWRDGAADLVLRTKAPIDTVCAAKGGWIAFTSGGSGFVLVRGATAPTKLAGAVRKGQAKDARSCQLDGTRLTVEVVPEDYSDEDYGDKGGAEEVALALPKGMTVSALVHKTPEPSTGPSPGGGFTLQETKVTNKFGNFAVLRRQATGGGAILVADTWKESESQCEDDSEPYCNCPSSILERGWLPGDILWVRVGDECAHGSGAPEDRVLPANGTTLLTGELVGSPDGRFWHIGSHLCGPNGSCASLPNQASDAVWTER